MFTVSHPPTPPYEILFKSGLSSAFGSGAITLVSGVEGYVINILSLYASADDSSNYSLRDNTTEKLYFNLSADKDYSPEIPSRGVIINTVDNALTLYKSSATAADLSWQVFYQLIPLSA